MEIPEELAQAAHKNQMAAGRDAAVDDLTTAIMTGASPAEISRLEASETDSPYAEEEGGDLSSGGGREAGELPSNEPRNAERIRLTGLEERDKGLVNAANIIARTERIPFDEAWRRVNGDVSQGHGDISRAQAEHEAQVPGADGGSYDDAISHEALKNHHLRLAGELYGELQNPGSEHWQEANRIATDPSHPDHDPEILAKPHAAMIIAKLAAANLGLRGGHSAAGGAIQPGGVARPAPATKQSAPPPPARSRAELARASEQAAMDAIEGNTAPLPSRAQRAYLRL